MLSAKKVIFVVAMIYFDYTAAAEYHQNAVEKPAELAHIPGCYFVSKNIVLPFGETYPEGQCEKYSCESSGAIDFTTCGLAAAGRGCQIVDVPLSRYPDCCPIIVCGD